MPNRQEERNQQRDHREWEPSGALRSALEGMPLPPGMDRSTDLGRLEHHLEEALGALERLERRRGLSVREKARAGALRMLMESIQRAR